MTRVRGNAFRENRETVIDDEELGKAIVRANAIEDEYFRLRATENKQEDRPAIPWRRVYGPALNSKLLDRGFLFGSLVLISCYFVFEALSNPVVIPTELGDCTPYFFLRQSPFYS